MGFLSHSENGFIGNPTTRFLDISGGEKAFTEENGDIVKKAQFSIHYYDGEGNVDIPLPYKVGILDQSHQITGFVPAANIRFWSNETFETNGELAVKRKEGDQPNTEILRGPYSQIKPNLPVGARYQLNLYVYNFELHKIERLNLRGSSLGAFFEYQKGAGRRGKLYESLTIVSAGELVKNGSVVFIPPKFSLGAPYTDDMKEELIEAAKELENYKNYLKIRSDSFARQMEEAAPAPAPTPASEPISEDEPTVVMDDSVFNPEPEDVSGVPF